MCPLRVSSVYSPKVPVRPVYVPDVSMRPLRVVSSVYSPKVPVRCPAPATSPVYVPEASVYSPLHVGPIPRPRQLLKAPVTSPVHVPDVPITLSSSCSEALGHQFCSSLLNCLSLQRTWNFVCSRDRWYCLDWCSAMCPSVRIWFPGPLSPAMDMPCSLRLVFTSDGSRSRSRGRNKKKETFPSVLLLLLLMSASDFH